MGVAWAAVASGSFTTENVVLASFDRLRRQQMRQLVLVRTLVYPLADRLEHAPLNLDSFVADGWVMERTKDIVDNLVNGHARVVPCIKHSAV